MSTECSFSRSCPGAAVCWQFSPPINTLNGPLAIASILRCLSPLLTPSSHFDFLFYRCPPLMPKTRAKNRLKHPAAPIMTRAQLTAAGIPTPPLNKPQKKQTKDQRIAALEEDLRITRELLQTVSTSSPLQSSLFTVYFSHFPTESSRHGRW